MKKKGTRQGISKKAAGKSVVGKTAKSKKVKPVGKKKAG